MKRFAALALFIALLLSAVAMAEGQLTVVEKNVVIQPEDGAGYFYARIENTGDAPVIYDYGQLVILSEEEEILEVGKDIELLADDEEEILDADDIIFVHKTIYYLGL